MLRHVFHPAWPWGLPGGWLKRNEAPEEGALRELKEETGLTAVIGPSILVSHGDHPVHTGIAYQSQTATWGFFVESGNYGSLLVPGGGTALTSESIRKRSDCRGSNVTM